MNPNPYAPPESNVDGRSNVPPCVAGPVRGGWLTSLLVILFLANVFMAFFYLLAAVGKIALPRDGDWAFTLLAIVVANVVFLVAIWNWRRWGLFGLIFSTTLLFSTHVAQGQSLRNATLGIVGLALVIVVASLKLKHFK